MGTYILFFPNNIYGIEVYGASLKSYIQKIKIMQNRILKTPYNKDWFTPTKLLHKA